MKTIHKTITAKGNGNKKLTVSDYPIHKQYISSLAKSHIKLKETPLSLLIWFNKNHKKDIFLLEIAENVPSTYSAEKQLFKLEFKSTPSFIIATGGSLWFYWLSEKDFQDALQDKNTILIKIAQEIKSGNAEVIYKSAKGGRIYGEMIELVHDK